MADKYRDLLSEYESTKTRVERLIEPAVRMVADELLSILRMQASRHQGRQESVLDDREFVEAALELDRIFEDEFTRNGRQEYWLRHLENIQSIVGPWPPR